jgi:SEC-C motif-containing protein
MTIYTPSCYCGSAKLYANCCAPFLSGDQNPSTAEALMRSRYSAFCLKDADYLLASLHKKPRAKESRKALLGSFGSTRWCSLRVIGCRQGLFGQHRGEVEFAAFYSDSDTGGQLHERSRFVFEDGRWFYVDGDILPAISLTRNEACWCGSGRKVKKCHPE